MKHACNAAMPVACTVHVHCILVSNMIQIRYAHIKSSETLASFKNQVRKVDNENLLRTVTCATLRIMGWQVF